MTAIGRTAKSILPDITIDILVALKLYWDRHGAIPNIFFPNTFNEKVVHRNLFDSRPILRRFADKYAVRSYVSEKLGPEILPKLYWVTDTPSDIPFHRLPDRFVVKPTHGAGWVRIVKDKASQDIPELLKECDFWLAQNFYERCRERVYKHIPRRILVEEFIDDGSEDAPIDYKLLVFHGRVEIITPIYDRFTAAHGYFLDRDWKALGANLAPGGNAKKIADQRPPGPPKHLAEMIAAAEILSGGMDFVRADFYDTQDGIVFGELTTSPGGGLAQFDPPPFDKYLGSFW